MIHPELLSRLCNARDLLRDWEDEPLSVSAVARASGLSRFHFIRLFKAMFGETPHRYRSRAQIEKAKHLLILTDLSITDVCMSIGFSSVGGFSILFQRRVGMPPSEFQRRYRAASSEERELPAGMIPGCLSLWPEFLRKGNFREDIPRARLLKSEAMRIKLSSIMVENQATALAFYTGVLGFRTSKDIPVGEFRWLTVVSPDGPDVELVLEPNANPAAKAFQEAMFKQGIPLAAFEVDDIDAEANRLQEHGVKFTMDPQRHGPVKLAIFSDTCGNFIQMYQSTEPGA